MALKVVNFNVKDNSLSLSSAGMALKVVTFKDKDYSLSLPPHAIVATEP